MSVQLKRTPKHLTLALPGLLLMPLAPAASPLPGLGPVISHRCNRIAVLWHALRAEISCVG